jgi:protease-4
VGVRRGLRLVMALLAMAFLVSIAGLLTIYLLVLREPSIGPHSTLVVRISGPLVEGAPEDVFGQFLPSARRPTVRAIVENLRKAKVDSRISAILLMPSSLQTPYWAKLQELRDAVLDFRRSGKMAVAYLEYGGDREYYLATACDRVFLMPASPLDLTGLASYEVFLRGTLDKIGAYPDLIHIGDYKTATNQLTEKGFTPAHREMSESLNRDLYDQLVRGVADGRKKSEADLRKLVDEGPFLPEEALRGGLIDDLAYADQIDDKVKVDGRALTRIEADEYSRISPSSLGLNRGPRIALVYAVGTITTGRSGYDPVNGTILGSDTLAESLRQIREDASIKAVVLRIDSPGGSAVASDVMWRELVITRDGKPARPLVASMSDLAASGGYYIAMAASTIVAQPATLTGSIGIFGGKVVTGGTFGKLGANLEAVSQGRNAELESPIRPYSAEERSKVEEQLRAFYAQFVAKAAQSRHMSPERVDRVAQGRVWTGQQAKEIGLVDALGGLDQAITLAKEAAQIPRNAEVELVVYPPRKSLYELVAAQLSGGDGMAELGALLQLTGRQTPGAAAAPVLLFRRGEPLALMPRVFLP